MNQPSNFLNSPGYGSHHPAATPIQQVQQGRVEYGRAIPPGPANNEPLLSVAFPNVLTLTKPLLAQLGLSKMGSTRVHLVVPKQQGGEWYLDTNPKPGMGAPFPARGRTRFYLQHISKRHFAQPRPLFGSEAGSPFQGNVNVFVKLLHFRLGPQVENYPGYYRLTPLTGPAHH